MKQKVLAAFLAFGMVSGFPAITMAAESTPSQKTSDEKVEMSIDDLGFSQADIQSDPQLQKDLETRSDMLRIHQILGLTTAAALTTQFVLGVSTEMSVTKGNSDTNLHTAVGLGTVALYGTTAAFAIFAPKPKGTKPSGNTEIHQILSWIHLPLMVLTPLVGDMINDRLANHQPIGNYGLVHGVLATALLTSYMASLIVVTF